MVRTSRWLRQCPGGMLIAGNFASWPTRDGAFRQARRSRSDTMRSVSARAGNVFSFPQLVRVMAIRRDFLFYDRLQGRSFSNLEIDFGDEATKRCSDMAGRAANTTPTGPIGGPRAGFHPSSSSAAAIAMDRSDVRTVPTRTPTQVLHVGSTGARSPRLRWRRDRRPTSSRCQSARSIQPQPHSVQVRVFEVAERNGCSADPRSLAVLFDSLKLRRLMDDGRDPSAFIRPASRSWSPSPSFCGRSCPRDRVRRRMRQSLALCNGVAIAAAPRTASSNTRIG